MKKIIVVLLPFLLTGCVSFESQLPSSKTYSVIYAELNNMKQKNSDEEECHWTSDNLPKTVSPGSVAISGGSGATGSGSVAWLNPLTILGGLIGGLANGFITGFDWNGTKSITSYVICVDKLTARDGSAVVSDYHLANVQQ